jgi:hypothetical protein
MRKKCPLGLVYRSKCIRTLKSVWDKKATKDYVIESISRTVKNIKPVIVIDDNDYTSECYLINATLDDFDVFHDQVLCRQIEAIAEYSVTKQKIQLSDNTPEVKETFCKLNEKRNYQHENLSAKDEKSFNQFTKRL